MNNNIRSIFFLLIFSIFKNITEEIIVGEGKYFMIDTGSERYVSSIELKTLDVKKVGSLLEILKNEHIRTKLNIFKNNVLTNDTYNINKDLNYIFCNCKSVDRNKDGKYINFKIDDYDDELTKNILNDNFNYDPKKFYYFFILTKENLDHLYNIKFNKIEVFNKNKPFKDTEVKEHGVIYKSKNHTNLKNYKDYECFKDNIINSLNNDFNDFFCGLNNLKKELYYAEKIEIKRIMNCNFEKIDEIITQIITGQNKTDNSLSIYIDYKKGADIILDFECINGYILNINEEERTIHFDIEAEFNKQKDIDEVLKESICDVINNATVRKLIEEKEFEINGKKAKLPSSCFKVIDDTVNFNKFKVIIEIPKHKENDKKKLFDIFLTKIPEENTQENEKKKYFCCKKNTNKEKK